MDDRCENLRLICGLDAALLSTLQQTLKDRNCTISGELQIPISSNRFNILMLLDSPSRKLPPIPRICTFSARNNNFEEIKFGSRDIKSESRGSPIQGQLIMDTIRYMNGKPASIQLNVLTKSQFVHDDGALLERYFLGLRFHLTNKL